MSNPPAPRLPEEPDRPEEAGIPPELEGPNPYGPDAPNVRPGETIGSLDDVAAPPPSPPAEPLPDDAYAPDEA